MLSLKSKIFLFPYWIALKIRHFLYDKQIKKSMKFPIPIICVGNITVGGTGKTPFTEMIIRKLEAFNPGKFKIMVLSRGYRRKSKGFLEVQAGKCYSDFGDEPLQIKNKFSDITVAVCENRCVGIENLMKKTVRKDKRKSVVILDDAFQHRKVSAMHSVVLMNYNNPIFKDNLLPIGSLRDLPEQIKRAQSIVVTNSPFYYSNEEYSEDVIAKEFLEKETAGWEKNLKLKPEQKLYFAATVYNDPIPIFENADTRYIYSQTAVFFSGIANDMHFKNHISEGYKVVDSLEFPDHCNFNKADVCAIEKMASANSLSIIFTTEKDSVRLLGNEFLSENVRKRLFYIPIETKILSSVKEKEFIESLVKV